MTWRERARITWAVTLFAFGLSKRARWSRQRRKAKRKWAL